MAWVLLATILRGLNKMKRILNKITVVIPVYNAGNTLNVVFKSLNSQKGKKNIHEVIFINDNSNDNSSLLIKNFKKTCKSLKILYVLHKHNRGLASTYNEGIKMSKSKYVILMHQDIGLIDKSSIEKTLKLLSNGEHNLVAVYPTIILPRNIYDKFSFWLKCLFSRFVDMKISNLTGKFDGFNKELLTEHSIFFNEKKYRTAGEDGAIKMEFRKKKLEIKPSNIEILHLHHQEGNLTLKDLIKKEAQMSEAYGALVRNYGIANIKDFILISFRPLLIIAVSVEISRPFAIIVMAIYIFLYTKLVYFTEYNNYRIIFLPLVNIYLLLISTYAYFKGFISGKQNI